MTHTQQQLWGNVEKSNLFEFATEEYRFVLAGYPVWKTFVSYRDSNIWIQSYFRIDVGKRIIFFEKARAKTQKELKESSILDQLICDDIEIERKRIEEFFNTIPENVIQGISKFPDSHWEAIEAFILLGSDILALINSNPVLAYIIINAKKISPSIRFSNEAVVLKKMILIKQKEIINKCGFPETNQMVKIFSKMDPGSVNVNDLVSLRNLLMIDIQLKERILNILSYAKTINQNLLKLTIYNSPLISLLSNKLFYELAASESFNEHLIKIKQLYFNAKRWQLPAPELTSLASINRTFEKQTFAVENRRLQENTFPPPPLGDSFYISAICRESDLISWSKRQHNCIRGYTSSIRSKQSYFYRVIYGKEEATLELKLSNGHIRKGDLLGVGNKSVTVGLEEMVKTWLKEARIKRKKVICKR